MTSFESTRGAGAKDRTRGVVSAVGVFMAVAGLAFAIRPGINAPAICAPPPAAAFGTCAAGPTGCDPALTCQIVSPNPDDAGNAWQCGCQTNKATVPWWAAS